MVIAHHPCIARSKGHLFQLIGRGRAGAEYLVQLSSMAGTVFLMHCGLFPGIFILCVLRNGL